MPLHLSPIGATSMSATVDELYRRHWLSVNDYERMGEAGIFGEGDRVELIEGEIIDMPPISSRHGGAVNRIANQLTLAVGKAAVVATQNPIRLGDFSAPQPDIALLKPRGDYYAQSHPQPDDVLLLIEVAETSLRYDRDKKLPLYASAGIRETWLVDIPGKALWICRDPGPDGYGDARRAGDLASLEPLGMPDCALDLRGLL
jgi:Uma2 family endonuclease